MTSQATPTHPPPISAEAPHASELPVRLGISRCLLGEPVRYDGGHKRDHFLVNVLGQHVEWVPVCPEVEAGFGTPRESMRLVDDVAEPRLITVRSHNDHTEQMRRYTKKRLRDLQPLNLSGYVFKKDSPSCGTQRVRVYAREGHLLGKGKGMFADAFQHMFPLTPVEEEGRLQDQGLREILSNECSAITGGNPTYSTHDSPVGGWLPFIRPTNISYWPTADGITKSLVD